MGFWANLFGIEKKEAVLPPETDQAISSDLPAARSDALDLGWYWSEKKNETQMAKVSQEDRATHLYVIGATGTGKTKFLEFLIQQDIERGNGFGVIDPHGDLIEDIKGFLVSYFVVKGREKEIAERVILIDPTDPKYTVTLNLLEKLPNVSLSEQVNELIGAFKKIWADSWGVRMEDLLRNALQVLGEAEIPLAELPRFLSSRELRAAALARVGHPMAQEYFQKFETMTNRAQITWTEPVMNKIHAFLADDRMRTIFASPKSSFNIREALDKRRILLLKLDKGRLKGAADLLGSLLLAKIHMAAFSRSDLPQNKRVPFYLYIDEFQNFASASFSVVLSEARKYALGLVLAHQTLSQITTELRDLILGNTGIQVYFRVNRHDAELLAKEGFAYSGYEVKGMSHLRPIYWSFREEWEHKIEELQNLPPRTCFAKHKIEGGMIPLETAEIEAAWDALSMDERDYQALLEKIPFGKNYLVSRGDLEAVTAQRQRVLRKEVKEEEKVTPIPEKPPVKKPRRKPVPVPVAEAPATAEVVSEGKEERQHKYFQNLIRRLAQEKGYRATIEHPTPDGQGRVDVSLERDGERVACEISVTSTAEQELLNIEKCLAAGYEKVLFCSPERKTLEKVKALVAERIEEAAQRKIFFLQPEELVAHLEAEAALAATREDLVKGYKVKVKYQAVKEGEKQAKREAVAQVIVQAMRRLGK